MPKLVNRHTHKPGPGDVYIGRGTKYGNPFKVADYGRNAAMERYLAYFLDRLLGKTEYPARTWVETLWWLRDRVLVCSCAPNPCHGDVIVEWIHAVEERLGMQGLYGDVEPTPEALDSGLIVVSMMAKHL